MMTRKAFVEPQLHVEAALAKATLSGGSAISYMSSALVSGQMSSDDSDD